MGPRAGSPRRSAASVGAGEGNELQACALGLLARRDHSRAELRGKLLARGFEPGDVDAALEQLQSRGLASDLRFTEQYARARTGRGYGPLRIRAELRSRGVEKEVISRILVAPEGGWQAHAERVRRQRFGDAAPRSRRDWARQARFLQHRGFSAEQIGRALAEGDE